MPVTPKKSLGQHWLKDTSTLEYIVSLADIKPTDVILEIGPGQGDLTKHLLKEAREVIAVEKDKELGYILKKNIHNEGFHLEFGDILEFDLSNLPPGYKVVANIPYYLTSNLIRTLSESGNPPAMMVLLVQKEVARRICAKTGQMSLLSVSTQLYNQAEPGKIILAKLFIPPPKVDSQVIILTRRPQPLFKNLQTTKFFRVVKAGFSLKRKKLRNSLSGGLQISKTQTDELLNTAGVDGKLRAQDLSLEQWHRLYRAHQSVSGTML